MKDISFKVKLGLEDLRIFSNLNDIGLNNLCIVITGILVIHSIFSAINDVNYVFEPSPYLAFLMLIFFKIWKNILIKKDYKSDNFAKYETIFSFSETGIKVEIVDDIGFNSYKWDDIHAASQIKDYFYLKLTNHRGIIIPKRCIEKEQIKELEDLIKRKLGNKAFSKKRYKFWIRNVFRGMTIFLIIFFIIAFLCYSLKN